MPYPDENLIIDLRAQELQSVINNAGDSWSAKDLVRRGVSVNINTEQSDYQVKALQFVANCLHHSAYNSLNIFNISITDGCDFDCLYIAKDGSVVNHKGQKLFNANSISIEL